jgi:hypothetical protein
MYKIKHQPENSKKINLSSYAKSSWLGTFFAERIRNVFEQDSRENDLIMRESIHAAFELKTCKNIKPKIYVTH